MEDADFSSELAASFLDWDGNDDDLTPHPGAPGAQVAILPQLQALDVALAASTTAAAPVRLVQGQVPSEQQQQQQHHQHLSHSLAHFNHANPYEHHYLQGNATLPQQQVLMAGTARDAAVLSQMQPDSTAPVPAATYATAPGSVPPQHHLHGAAPATISHQPNANANANVSSTQTAGAAAAVAAVGTINQASNNSNATASATNNSTTGVAPASAHATSQQQQHQQQQQQHPSTTQQAQHSTAPTAAAAGTAAPSATTMKLHPLGIQSFANCPPHVTGTLPMVSLQTPTTYMPLLYNPLLGTTTVPPQHMLGLPTTGNTHPPAPAPTDIKAPLVPAPNAAIATAPTTTAPLVHPNHNAVAVPTPVTAPPPPAPTKTTSKRASRGQSKKRRGKNSNQKQEQQPQQPPPFYLFDAPIELRTNFLQSQRVHSLQDSNALHYGMAVNGFHPQVNAQVNPVLPVPSTASSSGSFPPLMDARGKKPKKTGKERNEREQKRAQKITELIEKLRVSMEDGGWKVEVKSKYHTLSTCADYCKHLMKTTKEKEDAVEKARNELEMKKRKLEEEKANESRSDPESVTSSLTGSTGRSDDDDNGRKNVGIHDRKRKRRTDNEANNVLPNNSGVNASCTDAAADDDDGDDDDGVVMNVDNNDNDDKHANEDDRKKKAKNDDLHKDGTSAEPVAAAEATAQVSAASTATMEASVSENPVAAPLPASTNAVRADTASGTDTAASSNKMDDNKPDDPNKIGLAVDDNNNNTGPAVGAAAVVVHTSKKAKMPPNSSSDSSSGDDHVQNITLHDNKTASSVSDITDSNKGSSGSSGSISSTAAVARGTASRDRPETHADIVVKISSRQRQQQQQQQQGGGKNKAVENNNNANKKNSANKELTSLDSNFDLDFEDVFISSNVPQLIATPAGRIVACNDFFYKATGLSRTDMQRLTIFSMVRADKLPRLFEMVAEALREPKKDNKQGTSSSQGDSSNSNNTTDAKTNDKDQSKNANSNKSNVDNNSSGNSNGKSNQSSSQGSSNKSSETGSSSSSSGHTTSGSDAANSSSTSDYAALTLPCVSFPSRRKPSVPHHPHPLYMTVTLMKDEDPQKQCFHCVLTDWEGTNGRMGFVTPELLGMLFSETIESGLVAETVVNKAKAPPNMSAPGTEDDDDDGDFGGDDIDYDYNDLDD